MKASFFKQKIIGIDSFMKIIILNVEVKCCQNKSYIIIVACEDKSQGILPV